MIDRYMTQAQIFIIGKTSDYFVAQRDAPQFLAAYIVMPLAVGLAGGLDYIKLPLAAIEALAKAILVLPLAVVSAKYSNRCAKHLKDAMFYGTQCINKLLVGWVSDFKCMSSAFKDPMEIPADSSASYYGSNLVYQQQFRRVSRRELHHPSICARTV